MKDKVKSSKCLAILYGITAGLWIVIFILRYMDASYSPSGKAMSFIVACVWVICAITQTKRYLALRETQNIN